jgi:hypothetical protein
MDDRELEIAFELMGEKLSGRHGTNRSVRCPLAPWTHTKGVDRRASMTTKAGDPSFFKCWSCQTQGTLKTLTRLYMQKSGDGRAFEFVSGIEGGTTASLKRMSNLSYDEVKKKNILRFHRGLISNEKKQSPITEEQLKKFLEKVPKYAFDRGLTKKEVIDWEIGLDEKKKRMIIPVRDYLGRLCGVSGRDITGRQTPKYKHYPGFNKELVLYGENKIDRQLKLAYVVEGFMDVWHLRRYGLKNVLASMGTSLSDAQIQKLSRFFFTVVFIPDVDDAGSGMRFCQEYATRLATKIPRVMIAGVTKNPNYQRRNPPATWEPCDYKYLPIDVLQNKDPADLTKDEIDKVLSNEVVVDYL